MLIVGAIISVVLLGVIIHFVVSPKSSRLLRLVAIVALGFIGLSLGICGIVLIRGPSEDPEAIALPFLLDPSEQQPAKTNNVTMIITFLIIFLIIAGLIVRTSLNEKKKHKKSVRRTDEPRPIRNEEINNEVNPESDLGSEDDDSFNLDIK